MSTDTTNHNIEAYGAYPFSSDVTYQVGLSVFPHGFWRVFSNHPYFFHFFFHSRKQGLASILATGTLDVNSSPEVREELERRTRVFYFNK